MAKNNGNQGNESIDSMIRRIVREELKQSFTFNLDNTSGNELEEFNISSTSPSQQTARRAGTSKNGAPKGRVTKPTDRRLKQNRDL